MKIKNKITTLLAAALLTACTDYNVAPTYTVGEDDNTIVLRAGVMEGASGEITRAVNDEANHSKHTPFAENTVIALRMDGKWVGHSPSTSIKKKTNATLGAASGTDNLHNVLTSFSPEFYWDDYGTADPNNTDGRAQGLTIYGAAINKVTNTSNWPTALSGLDNTSDKWKNISWTVNVDQKTNGIINSDLLTSNNVVYNADSEKNNAYKFESRNNGKLLVFTHSMSKVTVVLTAGNGFKRTTDSDPATAYFENEPSVTLKNFYNSGTVDVEAKTSAPTTSSTSDINMHLETPSSWTSSHTATYEAVVFPGNTFENGTQILTFSVDGNSFNVTAKMLNAAIRKAIDDHATSGYPLGSSDLSTEPKVYDTHLLQAWNYKLQITVNKTALGISATIEDWNEITAAEDKPKINFSQCYGQEGTSFGKGFTLYRSTSVDGSYIGDGNKADVSYTSSKYTMTPQLYWPDHNTHYFFRGVWPLVGSKDNTEAQLGPTSSQVQANYVEVANVEYKEGYYPSDLMIGIPRKADGTFDEVCKAGHKTGENATAGICATDAAEGGNHTNNNEGLIHLNFQYVMSKVQFSLKSSGVEGQDKVNLTNIDVEIINGNKSGKIRLSDGKHEDFVAGDKGDGVYQLHPTTAETGFSVTTLDAIVPQGLSDDVKIRIKVTNSDSTTDVYEAQLNKIKVKTNDGTGDLITEWKPGNYYKYELDINKTAINVTATIKDWVPVTASDKVWF